MRLVLFLTILMAQTGVPPKTLPRTADGKPNLQGIWQVQNRASYDLLDHSAKHGMPAGKGVVEGGVIPYQPAALAKRDENFAKRATEDPLNKCFMPGVPRIMYMEFPFQIFQTRDHLAITFEWSQVYRLIYTNGKPGPTGIEFWMGDSRGRWEGTTLIIESTNHNDKTWFDRSGNIHSDALRVVERWTFVDASTARYEATIEDSKAFTRPWKMGWRFTKDKEPEEPWEEACFEGNRRPQIN
jgi:hypothetical protein